ncbi:MAG: saccharopine dehydrogenase NADP-binding domain-containing protein [Rivularia sp. (in: cyanobacteria)]
MSNNKNKILIVGGYGSVGQTITTILASQFPKQVIAAGRNYQSGIALATKSGNKIIPMELDINTITNTDNLLKDVVLVIVCVEQKNTIFVQQCIQKGINYVDICASYQFLSQIEKLDTDAKQNNSTIVLSVGLAPGLTNLLASYGKQIHPSAKHIDIFILLGLGEVHGKDAILWTLNNLNTSFSVMDVNSQRLVQNFMEGKQTIFPDLGTRTAYRFNFPEQHVLPLTLNLDSASSWLCFDTVFITNGLNSLRKAGFLKILQAKFVKKILIKILRSIRFGSDYFVVQADLKDSRNNIHRYSLSGYGEGKVTGLVAGEVAKRLLQSSFPCGVFHIEQLFQAREFIEAICEQDSRLTLIHQNESSIHD